MMFGRPAPGMKQTRPMEGRGGMAVIPVIGPGGIVTPAPEYPIGPGAVGGYQGPERGSVSELQATRVGGAPLPDDWTPPAEAPRRGFEPADAPVPVRETPALRVASSEQARAAAAADMADLGAGPWTERPDDFLGQVRWDLRERLIQRQMARMGAANPTDAYLAAEERAGATQTDAEAAADRRWREGRPSQTDMLFALIFGRRSGQAPRSREDSQSR